MKITWCILLFTIVIHSYGQQRDTHSAIIISPKAALHTNWIIQNQLQLSYKLELSYRFPELIEVGIYGGGSYVDMHQQLADGSKPWDYPIFLFGTEIDYYFLDHFKARKNETWDIYISIGFGGYKAYYTENYLNSLPFELNQSTYIDYSAFLGIQKSLGRIMGIYLEGGYGRSSFLSLGLNFNILNR